ncbi:hypothetical protein G3I44_08855 [Halogeometricum borinquense]|uniref:Uncharacterized protein n=1 Tax=Halogeometricum borinquense TaxID=60847 RepID=A0A6C0UG85_9EURY|nr:hypothetical protein [Halogeometricum borinquense]QIB72799.1 hypothetical protein G3I44_08855 [Halogeometricum borinquense]
MIGADLAQLIPAAQTVGIVLAEAIALYVIYGGVTRVAGPTAQAMLGGD